MLCSELVSSPKEQQEGCQTGVSTCTISSNFLLARPGTSQGEGAVVENTMGSLHVFPKPRAQRLHRYTPGAAVRGPGLGQQGLLGTGHKRHVVLHHGVTKSTVTPERSRRPVRVFLRKTRLSPLALGTYPRSCSQIPGPSMLPPPGQPPGSAGRPAAP